MQFLLESRQRDGGQIQWTKIGLEYTRLMRLMEGEKPLRRFGLLVLNDFRPLMVK